MLFPSVLINLKFKREHIIFKRKIKTLKTTSNYGNIPDSKMLLERMRGVQYAALETLVTNSVLDRQCFDEELVRFLNVDFQFQVSSMIQRRKDEEPFLMQVLSLLTKEYSSHGNDGIKARSGLMEHRYDAV